MTTVCAVARDGRVVMGADSCAVAFDRPLYGRAKIFEHPIKDATANPDHPTVLLGFSGHGSLNDLVRAHLVIDSAPAPGADAQLWAAAVAQAITELARQHGTLEDGCLDGNGLLGWAGRLWLVYTAGAHEVLDGIAAIGSGQAGAMGALLAMSTWPRIAGEAETLEDAVRLAVSIACELDVYSGGTPLVMSIP